MDRTNKLNVFNRLFSENDISFFESYEAECGRLAQKAKAYEKDYKQLYMELKGKITRYEFASGGQGLHRGFYCPSPILDIITGNLSKGKLLKTLTAKSKPTYTFGFDQQNALVIVENGLEKEIILHKEKLETGIKFSDSLAISAITECVYQNGKICAYLVGSYDSINRRVVNSYQETYTYLNDLLSIVKTTQFESFMRPPILKQEEYHFQQDSAGFLSSYTVTEFDRGEIKKSVWEGHSFKVNIKRKA